MAREMKWCIPAVKLYFMGKELGDVSMTEAFDLIAMEVIKFFCLSKN